MPAQFIWQLVFFVALNTLCFLLIQTACGPSKSGFAIGWLATIHNDVIYRLGSTSSWQGDLSPDLERNYREWNEQRLSELNECLGMGNCGPNQLNMVLVAARWFEDQVVERDWKAVGPLRQGVSMYKHLRQRGYTTLFFKNFEEALDQYRMFPDLVKLVIHDKALECYAYPECVQWSSGSVGIPAWKIFDFGLSIVHGQDIVHDTL